MVISISNFDSEPYSLMHRLAISPIGNLEPYIYVDLTDYNDIYDARNEMEYMIVAHNASEIKCEMNGRIQVSYYKCKPNWFSFLF